MSNDVTDNVSNTSTWMRALYMILFFLIYKITEIVIGAVVVLNFGFKLITGSPNHHLTDFGQDLSQYVFQIYRYLTFNTEHKPFPFDKWPPQNEAHKETETDLDTVDADAEQGV